MLIVAGHLMTAPQRRAAYLTRCESVVTAGRRAPGCLDFAISADPVDAGRVNILERWESRADVEAFRNAGPEFDPGDAILAASVAEYDVGESRPLT